MQFNVIPQDKSATKSLHATGNIIQELICFNCFRHQEVELNKKRPLYIKAKEKTAHLIKKLESAR